nr:hypothetical protein [Rhizobium album]
MGLFPRCQDIRIGPPVRRHEQEALLPKKVGNGALTGDEWRALRTNAQKRGLFQNQRPAIPAAAVFSFRWVRLFSG